MADIAVGYSALNWPDDPYEGHGYGDIGNGYAGAIELEAVPRSRAPSYVSTQASFYRADDDHQRLISHGRSPSDLKDVVDAAVSIISKTTTARSSRDKRRRLQGWRFGVAASAATATAVLFTNSILMIWAAASFPMASGIGTAYVGDCGVVNSWALWLHILINGLSSILLSASNYTMQCLSSPTRRECDAAHAKGDWVDIGVNGIRNYTRIRPQRRLLWTLLALSSIPIHLLFNSAVFKTLQANNYDLILVNPAFLEGGAFAHWYSYPGYSFEYRLQSYDVDDITAIQQSYTANESAWEVLSSRDCINAYGTAFVTSYMNVIVITNDLGNTTNNTVHYLDSVSYIAGDSSLAYGWICMDVSSNHNYECDLAKAKSNATKWTINDRKVDHCLVQHSEPHCKLQFSLQILIAVIICNAIKSGAMIWTLYRQKDATMVTVGDAIVSFLDDPDELTRGRCLMGKADVNKGPMRWRAAHMIPASEPPAVPAVVVKYVPVLWQWLEAVWPRHKLSHGKTPRPNTTPRPTIYQTPLRRRWFAAVSIRRWITTIGLCTTALAVAGFLLEMAVAQLIGNSDNTIISLGFGAVSGQALIDLGLPADGTTGLVASVLLANLPQGVLSFLYLMYNGLYTCMHLSQEWSRYAIRRRPLRVTTPHGEQRSTYYLQLPYTYGIPLIIASATLHWLVSESIFLARISIWQDGEEVKDDDISSVGYSCAPIVCIIVLGSCMLFVAIGMGFRRFASHIPVAGSCSVAIAAACHRPADDVDAAVLPVQWGEVVSEGTDEVRHCCFTSEEVQKLVPGRMYAGARDRSKKEGMRRRFV